MSIILKDSSDPKLINLINSGSIGVIPTDTVYGLICSAVNEEAVQRLYKLKSRDKKPGTVIAASIEQLVDLGLKKRYLSAVEQYWPGPISIVIPTWAELVYLHQSVGTLAVRVVDDKKTKKLLEKTGPLLTSSANLPGQPEANTIDEAKAYFGQDIDFYTDGGDLTNRLPSTVIRVVDDAIEVLRVGAVKIDETGRITK